MKKFVFIAATTVLPVVLLASGHSEESRYLAQTGREYDFLPRVVNFTIFAAILWYLLANPIRNFLKGRSEGIASRLKEIETKLEAAKEEQKEAQTKLEESEAKAAQIIEDARKEAKVLAEKITQSAETELSVLQKQYEEKIALEERKAMQEIVDSVLQENITTDDIGMDGKKVIDVVAKKVA